MILLNWIPEIYFFLIGLSILIAATSGWISERALTVFTSLSSFLVLAFYIFRNDLAQYTPSSALLVADGLSMFGRGFALLILAVFSGILHFEKETTPERKQIGIFFLVFLAFFSAAIFQANSLIVFLIASFGIYVSIYNLVVVENGRDLEWIKTLRQKQVTWGIWLVFVLTLFLILSFRFDSIYLNDWIAGISQFSGPEWTLGILGLGVLLAGALPLNDLLIEGRGTYSLCCYCLGIFEIIHVYWMRLGIPFFSKYSFFAPNLSQALISFVFGVFAILFMVRALRNKIPAHWLSLGVPSLIGLSVFSNLLPVKQCLASFYLIAISILLTLGFVCLAYQKDRKNDRWLIVLALVALVGAPPLVLGRQFFQMILEMIEGGNILAGTMMLFAWVGFIGATLHAASHVLMEKTRRPKKFQIISVETFLGVAFLMIAVSLALARHELISLLTTYPLSNSW